MYLISGYSPRHFYNCRGASLRILQKLPLPPLTLTLTVPRGSQITILIRVYEPGTIYMGGDLRATLSQRMYMYSKSKSTAL